MPDDLLDTARNVLRETFGHTDFRGLQAGVIGEILAGRSALAVNRIMSSTASQIYGHLNANGQVWLINPNGVLFGPSARVNVGGIVASTLDLDPNTLDSNSRRFAGNGKGSIVNLGTIVAADGGYVALLGNRVSNQGIVRAKLGTIAMAGASAATLTFDGAQLLHILGESGRERRLHAHRITIGQYIGHFANTSTEAS